MKGMYPIAPPTSVPRRGWQIALGDVMIDSDVPEGSVKTKEELGMGGGHPIIVRYCK